MNTDWTSYKVYDSLGELHSRFDVRNGIIGPATTREAALLVGIPLEHVAKLCAVFGWRLEDERRVSGFTGPAEQYGEYRFVDVKDRDV